jgi:hypothetical protein
MLSVSHSLWSIVSAGVCQLGPRVSSIVNTRRASPSCAPFSPAITIPEDENSQSRRCSGAKRCRDDGGQNDQESKDQQQCRGHYWNIRPQFRAEQRKLSRDIFGLGDSPGAEPGLG